MSRTAPIALALAPVLALFAGPPLHADEVDEIVRAYLEAEGVPGLSVGIIRDGSLVKEAGYGQADIELEAPARADTIYEIGSITKMFTATAIMLLVEEGKIDLDAPICVHLDDLPEPWRPVTVRQLLTHTSGIPSYTSAADFQWLARNDHSREAILDLVADKPMDFEPGAKWSYSNTGYYLLGMIVEDASGTDFTRFLDSRILAPLGMTKTRPNNPNLIIKGRASGYGVLAGLVRVNRSPLTPSAAFSAGYLISTVGDLAKWDAALRTGTLLKPESFEMMLTPVRLADGSTHPYGFGWGTGRRAGHRNFAHGGGTAGFASLLSRYPDDGLTVILLSNQSGADLGDLERQIARHYLPDLDIANAEPIPDPDPERSGRVRGAIEALLDGEIAPEVFGETLAEHLATEESKATMREVAGEGEMTGFDLIGIEDGDGETTLRYRAVFGDSTYLIRVILDGEGTVIGLWTEPADS